MASRIFLPPVVSLYITYSCQLSCGHCFLTRSGKLNQFALEFSAVARILEEARLHRVYMMPISGGDPLLHPKLFEILALMQQYRIMPLLGATGIEITPTIASRLKALGLPCVQVSLDGASEETNRKYRAPGVFEAVLRSIEAIQNSGLKANLAICCHKGNWRDLDNILALAKKLGLYKVKVAFWEESGSDIEKLALSAEEKQHIVGICQKYNHDGEWVAIPQYDMKAGKKRRGSKYPPLVIGADGQIQIGEFGEVIGSIHDDVSLASLYTKYVDERKSVTLESLTSTLLNRYRVASVRAVPASNLNCASLVYAEGTCYHILYRDTLPKALQAFVLLHEIGHIARGSIGRDPSKNRCTIEETETNLWALNMLEPHLDREFYLTALEMVRGDENALFLFLEKNLLNNMTNYWDSENAI